MSGGGEVFGARIGSANPLLLSIDRLREVATTSVRTAWIPEFQVLDNRSRLGLLESGVP